MTQRGGPSFQPKPLCIHDCQLQPLSHALLAAVTGQQQCIEACVTRGELGAVRPISLDDAAQVAEAPNGGPVAASEEF